MDVSEFFFFLSFPVWYFFRVAMSESMYIFALGPYSTICNSFPMLLFHSAFLLCSLSCYILLQNCFASLASDWWYVFAVFPFLTCRILFRCFGMSCFVCIFWSYLGIFFVFLLSPQPSDLSLRVISYCVAFSSLSQHLIFFFSLIIFASCWRFFFSVSNLISHPCLDFR